MSDTGQNAHAIYRLLRRGFDGVALEQAYALGLLRPEALIDAALYRGWCRNATEARWDAGRRRFVYRRTKFGSSFNEDIVHPVDDDGFDIFVALALVPEEPCFPSKAPGAGRGGA